MKIRQLPERLANKIAAGEVVERPASVVKELIENSIDAGSKVIKVELIEAGLAQIKVTDDGAGIAEDDVKKAFSRHATSKIKFDEDLFHIKTLGFRGEALSSIASVSKLTIKSSTGDKAGTMLLLEAGKLLEETKSDARKGTEITVEELFFNTPARLKYLKSIHTELSHITDLINRYALAQPHIRFEVYHNDKNLFSSVGNGNMHHVMGQIYGMNVARNMFRIEKSTPDFLIEGYIGKPEATRSNRNYITLIINGRYIKSRPLSFAIMRAYDTLLPRNRYPIVILSITLDPILIDVNVHPTKLEVRLSKEAELVSLIEKLINDQFKRATLIPEINREPIKHQKTSQDTFTFEQATKQTIEEQLAQIDFSAHEPGEKNSRTDNKKDIERELTAVSTEGTAVKAERIPALYPIGQLQGTYILAQNELGFYMIDQHAAQERIKYELFKKKLGRPTNQLQDLLIPITLDFTIDEAILIEKKLTDLAEFGLFLEAFGQQTYVIRAFPNWFPVGLEEEIIRDMILQVMEEGQINLEKIREELAIMMSCKQSIKANHYLHEKEMQELLDDLRATDDPFTCPHGRPVIIHFKTYDIEKMFKRIM